MDDATRKIIEHGKRIRACLKQGEFAPVSVPAQIALLLALAAGLFDLVPVERMKDARTAVVETAKRIPADVQKRLTTAADLSAADRAAIAALAREALAPFLPKPEPAKPK
jgi:F-type H+-transporting ATPase subunit alpha